MSGRLEQGVEAMRTQMDARVVSYLSSCVHCGICAEACLFFTETGDPRYTPIHKTEPMRKLWSQEYTFWGKLASKLGLSKPLTEEDFADWEMLVYDGCTMCGRCSMVCPLGVDIAYIIRKVKEGLCAAGYSPPDLVEAGERARTIGSPMGVTAKTLQATIRVQEKETGLDIPLDQEGAEYLCLFSSGEIAGFPEYIGSLARIFKAAGVSWTISSQYFEATNTGVQLSDSGLAAELVEQVVAAAEKLKVKTVVSPECGHAYRTIRWDAPNLIGRPLPFGVVQIMDVSTTTNTPTVTNATVTIQGFKHGPASNTSSTAANSGVIQWVSPARVVTTVDPPSGKLAVPSVLRIHFIPEPGLLLLLASGVGGLVLLGRSRMRG